MLFKLRNSSLYSADKRGRPSTSKKSLLSQSFNRVLSSQNKPRASGSQMRESGLKRSIVAKVCGERRS